MLQLRLLIDNEWSDAQQSRTFPVTNPATGEVIAQAAEASADDVDRAVGAARSAFERGEWSEREPDDRADILLRVASLLNERQAEFARLECLDSGKPIRETSTVDIPYSIRAFEYFANIAREVKGEVIPVKGKRVLDFQTFEPHGVVAAITPWNFPLHLFTRAICPALAAGNTVVAKTSPMTPATSGLLGELLLAAGMPAGTINILHGGREAGEALVSHPDVRMITFTGSEPVGRSIMEASSRSPIIKKMILELGGKGAFIADADCDVEAAVASVLVGFCLTQGQVCCASTRLYLHADIYHDFLDRLVRRAESLRIGDPLDPKTQLGTLMNQAQLDRVDQAIRVAIGNGATLLTGGKRLTRPPLDKGFFYRPTILEVDRNDLPCVRDEIFGPVLTVKRITSLDEGVQLANDTDFGLGAAVWSRNVTKLFRAARQLDAGTVWMNMNLMSTMEAPFGGNKNSGIGREYGTMGLREYMKVKNQMVSLEDEASDFYTDSDT
ncbi:aldehyde dehydrogenase [Phycisphaerales bacterium AB-hyl4]|uniref:Aldehyde dehydrogenase n=1 Tax=Natronomicrosphaera hydrolytica TaxID=3242702 RepID=A0ABV4UBJ4_9BACT